MIGEFAAALFLLWLAYYLRKNYPVSGNEED